MGLPCEQSGCGQGSGGSGCPVNEKAPVTTPVITGAESGRRGLNPPPLAPQASALAKLRYGPKSRLSPDTRSAERRLRFRLGCYLTEPSHEFQVRFHGPPRGVAAARD